MDDSSTDPLAAFREVNVTGTLNLAKQAAEAGVKRFIFISSIKVNGEMTSPNHPFNAEDANIPRDPYGLSKYEAEQGVARAQSNLGVMYDNGKGVAQDYKSAHMWLNIAAANEIPRAAELRDLIAKEMTPSQIKKAQDMAREWMAKH